MGAAPFGKILIDEFTVLLKQRVCDDREGHYVYCSYFGQNMHEVLLIFLNFIDIVDNEGAIREFFAAKKGFEIGFVKDRKICNLYVHAWSLRRRRPCGLLYVAIESGLYHELHL